VTGKQFGVSEVIAWHQYLIRFDKQKSQMQKVIHFFWEAQYTNRHPNGFWMLFGCLLVPLSMLTDGPFQLIEAHPTEFWMVCGIVSMLLGPTLDGRSEAMA